MELQDYNTTANNNTAAVPGGAPENGTLVSDTNNILREIMARLARYAEVNNPELTTGGTDGTYTLNTSATYSSYNGLKVIFRANHGNPGAATLNLNGMGPIDLFDGGNNALTGGELITGLTYLALYNGTQFQLIGIKQHGSLAGGNLHANASAFMSGFMSQADKVKLDGISAGAGANQSAAQIKTSYESNGNTNAYTDSEKTKLAGLTVSGTGYSTPAQVLSALLGVDGPGSGLNADTFQGNVPGAFVYALSGLAEQTSLTENDDLLLYRPGLGHQKVGMRNFNPPVEVLAGSRALVTADANKILEYSGSGALTITVANVFNPGAQVVIANHGTATITVAASGVDLQSANGLRIIQAGGSAVIYRTTSLHFMLAGNLQ